MNISVPNSNEDWHSCFQKSAGEVTFAFCIMLLFIVIILIYKKIEFQTADIFIELDSLGDFLPDSSTVLGKQFPYSVMKSFEFLIH